MKHEKQTGFADRLSTAAEAKKAMLERFQPKPMVAAADQVDRAARRATELEAVRLARASEREAARVAREEAKAAAARAALEAEQAALEAKRYTTKERKANQKADARGRKLARLQQYGQAAG